MPQAVDMHLFKSSVLAKAGKPLCQGVRMDRPAIIVGKYQVIRIVPSKSQSVGLFFLPVLQLSQQIQRKAGHFEGPFAGCVFGRVKIGAVLRRIVQRSTVYLLLWGRSSRPHLYRGVAFHDSLSKGGISEDTL